MTSREFEDYIVKMLGANGYWAHRIAPDESGQQPFDVIAFKGWFGRAYDAKILTRGNRFPLSRIEDNQLAAFQMFQERVQFSHVGCLILHDGKIRFLGYNDIARLLTDNIKSVDVRKLPEWLERRGQNDKCLR